MQKHYPRCETRHFLFIMCISLSLSLSLLTHLHTHYKHTHIYIFILVAQTKHRQPQRSLNQVNTYYLFKAYSLAHRVKERERERTERTSRSQLRPNAGEASEGFRYQVMAAMNCPKQWSHEL